MTTYTIRTDRMDTDGTRPELKGKAVREGFPTYAQAFAEMESIFRQTGDTTLHVTKETY